MPCYPAGERFGGFFSGPLPLLGCLAVAFRLAVLVAEAVASQTGLVCRVGTKNSFRGSETATFNGGGPRGQGANPHRLYNRPEKLCVLVRFVQTGSLEGILGLDLPCTLVQSRKSCDHATTKTTTMLMNDDNRDEVLMARGSRV